MLDIVPNHSAVDADWATSSPSNYVQKPSSWAADPSRFIERDGHDYAFGSDPYSGSWTDTLQFNYWSPSMKSAMADVMMKVWGIVAAGLSCPHARLVAGCVAGRHGALRYGDAAAERHHRAYMGRHHVSEWIFASRNGKIAAIIQSGGHFCTRVAHLLPAQHRTCLGTILIQCNMYFVQEFWADTIPAVKKAFPGFQLLAEVYVYHITPQPEDVFLQQLGFDFTYNKQVLDHLEVRAML